MGITTRSITSRALLLIGVCGFGWAQAAELQYQSVTSDTLFSYEVATFKSVGGSWQAKWRLTNQTKDPVKVGVVTAEYSCGEGAVTKKHYISRVIEPGESKANISDSVCKSGKPQSLRLVDVEFSSPNGSTWDSVLNCGDRNNAVPVADRRYVVNEKLLTKGIAQYTFRNGKRFTYRMDGGDDYLKNTVIKSVCGENNDTESPKLLTTLKKLLRDYVTKQERACKKDPKAEGCGDKLPLPPQKQAGSVRG